MKRRLGNLERQLLAYAQLRKVRELRTGDLTRPLGITAKQERELYSRLARAGLIAQVRRGLYLIPRELPLGGAWTPDEALALNTLMADRGGRYQICGPNAFNRYGFSDQVPNRVYAYNNRLSGERTIGAISLTLIKVADARLGDTEESTTREGLIVAYSSRVRTLVDAVYDWARFGSLPRGYVWITRELAERRVTPAALVAATLRYGDVGTIRRMGALLGEERRQRRAGAEARRRVAGIDRHDSVDSHQAQTRDAQSPMGTDHERRGLTMPIRWHADDRALLLQAIELTARQTGFNPRLIEKDYFCSVVLEYLAAGDAELTFKGGTCLAKIHSDFYRLSEDLDFSISTPPNASRKERSRRADRLKPVVGDIPKRLPGFQIVQPLRGANESTQYNAVVGYVSLLDSHVEPISIEVGTA